MIWIRSFDDVSMTDIASVGGKNASLGEMRRALTPLGIRTPEGFATTADAYRAFLRGGDLEHVVRHTLADLDISDLDALQSAGAKVRSAMLAAPLPTELTQGVREGYRRLQIRAIAGGAGSISRERCPMPS
jgi:pyruvate,water dikinase